MYVNYCAFLLPMGSGSNTLQYAVEVCPSLCTEGVGLLLYIPALPSVMHAISYLTWVACVCSPEEISLTYWNSNWSGTLRHTQVSSGNSQLHPIHWTKA